MERVKRGEEGRCLLSRHRELALAVFSLILLLIFFLNHEPNFGSPDFSTPSPGRSFFSFFGKGGMITGAEVLETQNAGSSTACGGIASSITLASNVVSTGTCYTINASHITLNCAGYTINYSSDGSTLGYGVNASGFSNVTIKNCIIKEGHINTNNKHALLVGGIAPNLSSRMTLFNNTITITGLGSRGIFITESANYTNISFNIIKIPAGGSAEGIALANSSHALLLGNNITTIASSAAGLHLENSENNTFTATWIYVIPGGTGDAVRIFTDDAFNRSGNTFLNLTVSKGVGYAINDLGGAGANSTLIYDGTFGRMNWTSGNLTTNISLTIDTTLFLRNGTVGLTDDAVNVMKLNQTADITMRGLPYSSAPWLLKAGERCDNTIYCNVTFSASTGILTARISSFSNYTTNLLPTQGLPVLNSTDPSTNNSDQNLTAYNISSADEDGHRIRNIFNWRVNGTSLMVLNLPFERVNGTSSNNAWDYSGFGNNLSEFFDGGAAWNATGGLGGTGAYRFNGGDYLAINNTRGLNLTANFTITLWVYRMTDTNNIEPLFSASNDSDQNIDLSIAVDDTISFLLYNNSGSLSSDNQSGVSLGAWTFIAINSNGSFMGIYVNGSIKGVKNYGPMGFTVRGSALPWRLGRERTTNTFDGLIDQVQVYNRSLSSEQILAIFNNRTDLIVSQETTTNQNWTVDITVNDGYGDGNTSRSNQVIVTDLVGCGIITSDTTMNQNLSRAGTCFTLGASGVTLDCNHYEINYSRDGTWGNAIANSGGYGNVKIKNCIIKEGTDVTEGKTAINFSDSALNCSIVNNTLYLVGNKSIGISVINSNHTGITENVILTSGGNSPGMRLLDWHHDNASNNVINTTGGAADALILNEVSNSSVIDNILKAHAGYGLYLVGMNTVNNTFWNNTILSALNYTLYDNSSSTRVNQLIYNSTYGLINWTLGNLTTALNLSVKPVEGADLNSYSKNTIYLDNCEMGLANDANALQLNSTATGRITLLFYNITFTYGYSILNDQLYGCIGTTSLRTIVCNATQEIAHAVFVNVSGFSNYTAVPLTASGTVNLGGESSAAAAAAIAAARGVSPAEAQAMIAAQEAAIAAGLISQYASPAEIKAFFDISIFAPSEELARFREEYLHGELSPEGRASFEKRQALAGGAAGLGLAAGGGTESRSLTRTETLSVTFTNRGDKPVSIRPEVDLERFVPKLANQDNAEKRIRELIISRSAKRDLSLTAEKIEEKVREEAVLLRLIENENVRQLVGRTLGAGRMVGRVMGWLKSLFHGGLSGAAVADSPESAGSLMGSRAGSLSGITSSSQRVGGRLLKPELLDMKEIIVAPGSTLQKDIPMLKSLSSRPREMVIAFTSQGEKVLERSIIVGEIVYGSAVDVNPEENLIDLYFVVPPAGEGREEYLFEFSIEKEEAGESSEGADQNSLPAKFSVLELLVSLLRGRTALYSEVFGPYQFSSQEPSIFAHQLLYDQNIYQGDYLIRTKLVRDGGVIAEQSYPVTLG